MVEFVKSMLGYLMADEPEFTTEKLLNAVLIALVFLSILGLGLFFILTTK